MLFLIFFRGHSSSVLYCATYRLARELREYFSLDTGKFLEFRFDIAYIYGIHEKISRALFVLLLNTGIVLQVVNRQY